MTMLAVAPPWTTASSINLCCATPVLPVAIGQLSSPPLRPLPKELLNARGQQITSAENPIASDALLRPTSRGFLPWRFADAGPGVRGTIIMGRHPKTFTIRNSWTAANNSSIRSPRRRERGVRAGHHIEAERFGGLEVDHQFELGRLFDRQVGGLRTLIGRTGTGNSM